MKRTPLYDIARHAGASFFKSEDWTLVDAFAGEPDASLFDGRQLALCDRSSRAKIMIEGAAAAAVVERAWHAPALDVNGGVSLPQAAIFRLRHDRYFISAPSAAETTLLSAARDAVQAQDGLVTVTAASHGRAELWLVGNGARELLSRLCGLDLHPDRFPNLTARQTSVAKTAQLVIRADLNGHLAFALVGARSLGAYLWQTISAAAHDIELQPVGERFLQALAAQQEQSAGH